MTFIPSSDNSVSTLNSTNATLTANSTYLGTAEDVSKYSSVVVTMKSDVDSAALGVNAEFSTDNVNWDVVDSITYDNAYPFITREYKISSRYFRVRYTNGSVNQATFRLQTRFNTESKSDITSTTISELKDSFGRLRVSEPFTIFTNNFVVGINPAIMYQAVTGGSSITYDSNASHVVMSTALAGTAIMRSRQRTVYQPGKSLLVLMTGAINYTNNNNSVVTTRIGYYDNDSGYYFQYNNGIMSIVERTTVTGVLSETKVAQSDWNVNSMDGKKNGNITLDSTKAIIYWFNLEWLGVGFVDCGVIVDGATYKVHRFKHSNLLTTPYMRTASLYPTYELISTGAGTGSMTAICQTVMSEGGYSPIGSHYSANNGITVVSIPASTRRPVFSLRLSAGALVNIKTENINCVSTSTAIAVVEIWRYNDANATGALTGASWVNATGFSKAQYDVSATSMVTTGGTMLDSIYMSSSTNVTAFPISENGLITNVSGTSDVIVVAVTHTSGSAESFVASITWSEYI